MEYKAPFGTAATSGVTLAWQGSSVAKAAVPASRLYPAQHVRGSPFGMNLDDVWTSLGTKTGEVTGGMQVRTLNLFFLVDFSQALG